ncbi:MAG TPA: trypsin-like serine protease [Roseiarcus sp.]|nr:trypsin-like serine protease [Roseiarcus sp.]
MISARRFAAAAAFLSLAAPALAIVGPARDGDGYANRIVMVLARHGARQSVCSGVALAPRLVLTAAHCLESAANTLVAIRRDGRTAPVVVAAVARHPRYDPNAPRDRRISIDIGLLETATPLDGFKFAEIAAARPALGEAVTVAGFGVTREGGPPSDGHIRAADLVVAAPLSNVTLWTKDPEISGLGACHGDSGGPIYAADGRLAAVVAWTNGVKGRGCGAITQGPLLGPERAWIAAIRARWGQ